MLGEGYGLGHDLREIREGFGGFGLDASGGDGFEDAANGPGEIAGGDIVAFDFVAKGDAGLLLGEQDGFFLGVGIAEARMGWMAEIGAAAAVGKGE